MAQNYTVTLDLILGNEAKNTERTLRRNTAWVFACSVFFFFGHDIFHFFLSTADQTARKFLSQNTQPPDRWHLCSSTL